jgi:hypothetical protein
MPLASVHALLATRKSVLGRRDAARDLCMAGMRCFRRSSIYTSFGYPTDAPFSISNSAVSTFSQSATQCSEVSFSVVRALTDAPFLINNTTVSAFPPTAVQCSRVSLSVVRALTYVPFSISDLTCFEISTLNIPM